MYMKLDGWIRIDLSHLCAYYVGPRENWRYVQLDIVIMTRQIGQSSPETKSLVKIV